MSQDQPNNPLHGVTLKAIMEHLLAHYSWQELWERVPLNCFARDPSLKSSLRFLRKTPWARDKIEQLYLADVRHRQSRRKRNKRRAEQRLYRAQQEAAGLTQAGEE